MLAWKEVIVLQICVKSVRVLRGMKGGGLKRIQAGMFCGSFVGLSHLEILGLHYMALYKGNVCSFGYDALHHHAWTTCHVGAAWDIHDTMMLCTHGH
jgi:hypothetical protein